MILKEVREMVIVFFLLEDLTGEVVGSLSNSVYEVLMVKVNQVNTIVRVTYPDLEIVVYPGILVPRIYLSLQNIFKEFSV